MPVSMRLKAREGGVEVRLWTENAESAALDQLKAVASLPIVFGHVAAMPDVHVGRGATIGSVIATRAAIIPAAVGVDIGCGMHALDLGLDAARLPESLRGLRGAIEDRVPTGFSRHGEVRGEAGRRVRAMAGEVDEVLDRTPGLRARVKNLDAAWAHSMGTLGGGNHFIEICVDERERVWLMLHSGSRALGNAVGRHFTACARARAEKEDRRLPDRDLGWLDDGTREFDDYVRALRVAQRYALENRRAMVSACLEALRAEEIPIAPSEAAVECHHNYVARERHYGEDVWLTRKGAISARGGELGIVPGSMGARSYIVRGRGAPESFASCAHGAGRRMSRAKARAKFSVEDLERATAGIECRTDAGVLDEAPGAYKDIDEVMAHQSDLASTVHTLRQVLNVKG